MGPAPFYGGRAETPPPPPKCRFCHEANEYMSPWRRHNKLTTTAFHNGSTCRLLGYSWARSRVTTAVEVTAMTSSGHVALSVTSPINSARSLSYRLPIVNNLLPPVVSEIFIIKNGHRHDVCGIRTIPNATRVHTPPLRMGNSKLHLIVHRPMLHFQCAKKHKSFGHCK